MQLFDELNNDNFILFATRNYNNKQCTDFEEFYEDLKRFKYLKRLFSRYGTGDLQERLILNHLIVLYNVFGIEAANRMIFFKIDDKYWPQLKTFLVFLNFLPEKDYIEIALDPKIIETLRKL